MYLGIDTSNYTTSVALFDGEHGRNCSKLLDVSEGSLGLRQSDALFAHTKRLPELMEKLFDGTDRASICAVGVSTRPRAVEGSYMPCFLAGVSVARSIAAMLGVPCYDFSHQQGHISAALWSSDRMDLMEKPHLAWHLSGGTTELLLVTPDCKNVIAEKIGGTKDISAGQIMDRTGKLLELPFPSGKRLDEMSRSVESKDRFKVKSEQLCFSLSGLENKITQYLNSGRSREETASYAVRSVCDVILRTTQDALKIYHGLPVVFSGGVASNSMLRELSIGVNAIFAPPEFSTDNAMGAAVLAWYQEK